MGPEHRMWGVGWGNESDPSPWVPTHPHPKQGMLRLSCATGGGVTAMCTTLVCQGE